MAIYEDVVIIGLGGIGSILCDAVSKYLKHRVEWEGTLYLVDGDTYETKNLNRQHFLEIGNKAKIKWEQLRNSIAAIPIQEYVTSKNCGQIIDENMMVFCCVDNHKTRKLIQDHCSNLVNIILINGGNELTDGNVQCFQKINGEIVSPEITYGHPEIQDPKDKAPYEMSCEELAKVSPQIIFTNITVATIMMWYLYHFELKNSISFIETYFDIETMSLRTVNINERRM